MTKKPVKVLQVAAIDTTVHSLLKPLLDRLRKEGYNVHVACSPGPRLPSLEKEGYSVHPISIARKVSPLSNVQSLWCLYRLMRRERFAVVHVHTPVAAALGRIAAKLAQVPMVVYTAHGFYFHELMPRWKRRSIISIERALGQWCTDLLLTQSAEDADTAVREKIAANERVVWIGNGVDPQEFVRPPSETVRTKLGFTSENRVIGFIGRLVREKGVEELFEAMARVATQFPKARLLVVGDTLKSDRDTQTIARLNRIITSERLDNVVKFTGFRDDTPDLLAIMDVFVLPSHREGMPRTILEAMAAGKPVVATNIRGCREEVLDEATGLLVPVCNSDALAEAILRILSDDELAHRIGEAGRKRVQEEFDEADVLRRQVDVYRKLLACVELED
jgi:glycosyltransferase involved in cell wall biosynthesis